MIRIGDFSKLSRVSVKTLRYYDEVGLLKPVAVDDFTGYRFYSVNQLPRLNRILALKDLGFSLEQIAGMLDEGLPAEQMRGMLRLRQSELSQEVQEDQERLARVEARLRQIEQEGKMPRYEVVLKTAEPQLVASVRDVLPSYREIGQLIGELYAYLGQRGMGGLCGSLWHDEGFKDKDVDAEAIVFIDRPIAGSDRVRVYELAGGPMASSIHHGSYNTIDQAYAAVMHWIEANGYRVKAAAREIYLQGGERGDDKSFITEVQVPVEKV